ncbi:unnamed protein product [Paramecium pentaurelia]|uniref:EGF-like domain-containing protein n=1 Tax=Paramecium pentaurelia TaxID=43138 RepID=A0A8S1TXJ4_9CILI|nr:unnamed protein product [Paramecium pentaurelia]
MQTIRILFTIFIVSWSQWELVSEDLMGFSVSSNKWNYRDSCDWDSGTIGGSGSVDQCSSQNIIQYIQVGSYKVRAYYSVLNLPPHYEVKVIVDGYFLDSTSSTTFTVKYEVQGSSTIYSLEYRDNKLQSYDKACRSSFNKFEIQTFIMTFDHNDNSEIRFRVCGTNFSSSRNYGVRSLQIYVNPCHWSCLKCSSNSASNCLACFTNPSTTLGSPSTCSSCLPNKAFIEYIDDTKSCVTECHYYRVPDSNKVCQFNENMLPYITYFDTTTFSSTSPWVFVPDPINYNLVYSQKISLIPCETSKNYVGPFFSNEAFSVTLSIPYNISYIRFRATIVKLNDWADYSAVHVLLDNIEFASVYTISQVLTGRDADQLYSELICTPPTVGYFRLEAKLKSNITNPVLSLQGSMDQFGLQSWGFRDVVMDIMRCQSSCSWCDFDLKCYACSTGFLYKNRCVPSCPVHSVQTTGVCTDFDEPVDYTKYLIKEFYDSSNTTDIDLNNIVGSISTIDDDFSTSDHFLNTNIDVYFSYYMGKRVFGGPLVWHEATFTKAYTLNPHYKFRLKFTLILGDELDGDFQYTIGGYSDTIDYSECPHTASEIGRDRQDKYITIDRTLNHNTASFSVLMRCHSDESIEDGFCIVYDYFILIYECIERCTACTGPTWAQCTGKQTLPVGMSSPSTYQTVTPAVCRTCTPSYCLECKNSYICTKCATNFYLQNGNCQCYPWTYLTASNTCANCHPLCGSCYGPNSNQCLSCNNYQHRYLNNNICLCLSNYYDDGVNYNCQSICGDMIVTEGEDCDDGNTTRFDGCNNCKFECQKECQTCVNGQCSVCAVGYTLQKTMKRCFPTCGNISIVSQEQCEDNNLTPYDGCYNCQFQCQLQCTNCIYGKCYQCDNSIGYYINLATFKCVTLCGDLIVAGGEMCDDGNNIPFDGCNSCAYSCDSFCDLCILGICTKCKQGFQLLNKNGQCAPICGDKIVTYYEGCDDGNIINYDGCDQCLLTCQEQCTSCILGKCYDCNTPGYQLNQKLNKCTPLCGDYVLSTLNEQCDDGNNIFEDGCYQCKYECQAECQTCAAGICYNCKSNFYLSSENICLPVCGDGIITKFESCDDKNYVIEDGCSLCTFQCEKTCTQCYFGICKSCQSGYYLDKSVQQCFPICGDKIIQGDEQCDIGIISFDDNIRNNTGCINCKLQCSPQCEICIQGQCLKCKESLGWYLDHQTSSCYSLCGDSIISDYEECEDSNSQLNDGCSQCMFKCSQECSICIFGLCYQCKSGYTLINQKCLPVCEGCNNCVYGLCLECKNNYGWYLNLNNQCESKCGDLIINNQENCDENSENCENCNFVCDDNCNQCQFGICQSCILGYKLLLNKCISICGDQIQTNNEDCENDDIIPFDGCYLCKFQCQDECQQCVNGECISCNETYGWYLQNKRCVTKCGDGIIAGLEECDINLNFDNGDISFNQCFNCKLSCVQHCLNCDRGICTLCQNGYFLNNLNECENICGNQTIEDFEVCDDDNLNGFDGCFSCQYDCQSHCQVCVNGQCILCEDGFLFDQDSLTCQSICGDMKLTQYEECDDGNDIPYDGCHNCKYSCTENCDNCVEGVCQSCQQGFLLAFPKCIPDCKDIIQIQNYDQCNLKECQSECIICIKGDCYQCQNGWYLNQVEYICESMCGDQIIVGQEQCENFLSYTRDDSQCNNQCQFECPYNCYSCSFGICQQCQQGYYLIENECHNYCGDYQITKQEQCDDDNKQPFDGCFQCRIDCEEQCSICIDGICEMCLTGYEIIDGSCYSICGDGIITVHEDCDDLNSIKNDGCDQCKFQCDQNCYFCEFGKCIFCSIGYQLLNGVCIPVCGDGIIAGNEECDTGLIYFDGYECVNCKFKCSEGCNNCVYGLCLECKNNYGWYLNLNNQCESKCGDLIINNQENCDENSENCENCNFVCDDNCNQCQFGICQSCILGYKLLLNKCISICGDQIQTNNEDCENDDIIPFDGCYLCKFQCQDECQQCVNGECISCNETYGWYLQNKRCVTKCGDGIIAGLEECDINLNFDNGDISFNQCFNCKLSCVQHCLNCDRGICTLCQNGYFLNNLNECENICGNQTIEDFEVCDDDNLNGFDGCFSCQYDCQSHCQVCVNGQCILCEDGFLFDQDSLTCQSICGDMKLTQYEECDDGNDIPYDGCHNCKYSCTENCDNCVEGVCQSCQQGFLLAFPKCIPDCKDIIQIQNYDQCNLKECQSECIICIKGDCYQCQNGWYLNQVEYICESMCGDQIIVGQEQCENFLSYTRDDSQCNNQCQFECPYNCYSCSFGICQQCQQGYYLIENECHNYCGDYQITKQEQCDDDNKQPFDGCFQCRIDCEEQCSICIDGICEMCLTGYEIIDGSCYSICGDGIITVHEDCDDLNSIKNDGCDQCKFQCDQNCYFCEFGKCIFCSIGYQLLNGVCIPVCGDGIIAGNEECDTGLIYFDGYECVNCKFKCSEGCNNCVYGLCLECKNNYGWYLNLNNQCESKCGDLIINNQENCDENSENCENCNFVCDDNCNQCQFGICQSCILGYKLLLNKCISICGDQIQTNNEDCENDDIIPFDGCYLCKFQCQDECQQCVNGECISCNETYGWYLQNKRCVTKCGDGIIAGLEECDINLNFDNGDISFNQCFNCKLSCVQHCLNCDRGICTLCQNGYFLNNLNECENICGNQTIEDFEVCDDDNLNGFDGCFSCQYDCQSHCQVCVNGQCILCEDGFLFDQDSLTCQSICGDMKLTQYEECDDGNDIPYDGCHNCKYSCTENCDNCVEGVCQSCQQGFLLAFPKCIPDCKDIIQIQNYDQCNLKECQSECIICIKGDCYQCQNGWYLNQVEYICESMCGDQIIVGQEQCENFLSYTRDDSQCNNQCQFECPYNCYSCSFGICQQCQQGYHLIENECHNYCGDYQITKQEQCDDDNIQPFDGCFQCRIDCEEQCSICIDGICEMCLTGYEIIDGSCYSICGDGIITVHEDCDDQNSIKHDGCDQCKFQCDQNCYFCEFGKCIFCSNGFQLQGQKCNPVCGDGLIVGNEKCDDGNIIDEDGCFECQYSCQQQCQTCLYGSCILCNVEEGWHLTSQGDCQTVCGDNKAAGLEQCDDGNEMNYDGCYLCKYICQDACTKCVNGQCYECNTPGWRLENYFCWEICGDALKVGIEECDDGNDIPYDGCFECKTQCEEACKICADGQCQECIFGWLLNENHRCETICGDKYIVPIFEDCDDGNLLPYDGCYECNYQCVQHCTDCRKDICYECNTTGWTYENKTQQCIPICGDGEINGQEQCDDGNKIELDGCSNSCEYQCHFACLNCDKGRCLECDRYLGFFELNNQCASKCGDGLWEEYTEQCDDGNLINQDGCDKNCKIEVDWYCKNEPLQISICIFKRQPCVELKLQSQEEGLSKIEVTFSTQMMYQQNNIMIENENNPTMTDMQLFLVRVDELNESDFEYVIEPVVAIQEFPQEVKYIIDLKILKNVSIDQINVMVIVDKKLIITEDFVNLEQNSGQIKIAVPFIESELSKKVVELFSNANEISMYAAMSVSLLSVFSTGYSNLYMTLDTIQYLYYTRYINLEFPSNLQKNMDNLKKSSLNSIVNNKLSETGLSKKITAQSQENNQKDEGMPNKFKQDNLQYQFTSNIKTTAVSLSAGLSIFLTTLSLSKLLHLIPPHKLNGLGSIIGGGILKVRQKCTKISNDFVYSGAIRLITINFYEMQFASLLQLSNVSFNSYNDIANNSGAAATLAFTFIFTSLLIHKIRQIQTKQSLAMKHYIITLFQSDEKSHSKSTWQIQYNTILLVKKSFYMLTIVCFQSQGLYQTIGVATQAAAFATYLAVSSPFSNYEDQIKQMITELGMVTNTLSFIMYYTQEYFSISKESLNQIGWFNIGIFTTVLTSNLAIDLTSQIRIFYKKAKKIFSKFIQGQMPTQSRVQPIFV